jgi:hypothetical protein
MKKQVYLQPTMTVVKLQHRTSLLQASLQSVDTNLTGTDAIIYGNGGSSDAARVKDYSVWSDDWSE